MKKILVLLILSIFFISSCTFFTSAPGTYKYGEYEVTRTRQGRYAGYFTTVYMGLLCGNKVVTISDMLPLITQ